MTLPDSAEEREPTSDAAFEVANRVFFRLYQTSNQLHKIGTRSLSAFGATTQQWAVLGALARPRSRERGVTVKELMEFLMVSRQNLTPVLDRLGNRGWIERLKDADDGRSRRTRLTEEGAATWAQMQAPIETFYFSALRSFSLDEQVTLFRLLDRLKAGFGEL
jgi:DNA-binding MarR family transcriptional regulator